MATTVFLPEPTMAELTAEQKKVRAISNNGAWIAAGICLLISGVARAPQYIENSIMIANDAYEGAMFVLPLHTKLVPYEMDPTMTLVYDLGNKLRWIL